MTAASVSEETRDKFPLHSSVWENDYRTLERDLAQVCEHLFVLNVVVVVFLDTTSLIEPKVSYFVPPQPSN